jgi:micrococcal nuclease
MTELALGKTVTISADPSQTDRDKYDRLLRYVYREDGLFINLELIKQGYAYEYTYDQPYQQRQTFKNAQYAAQTAQIGLWESCK